MAADTQYELLIRIDERTMAMAIDLEELKGKNDAQDLKIENLQKWRNGMAGAIGLALALLGLLSK